MWFIGDAVRRASVRHRERSGGWERSRERCVVRRPMIDTNIERQIEGGVASDEERCRNHFYIDQEEMQEIESSLHV